MFHFARVLPVCLFMIACLWPRLLAAQSYAVSLHRVDGDSMALQNIAASPGGQVDAATAFAYIQGLVPGLQAQGYMAASVDSIAIHDNQYEAWVFLGQRYRWAKIDFNGVPQGVVEAANINTTQWEGQLLNARQLSRVTEQLLGWAENSGYPFARAWLDAAAIDSNGGVSGSFILEQGPLRIIDSIVIAGDVRISENFMLQYLGLERDMPYNEQKLRAITPRLRELPFVAEDVSWDVQFKLTTTILTLYLKEKKANQLNAIVGILPNNVETGKLLLTADILFAFQNILGSGESISLTYQNLQYKSPRLKTELVYPYLLGTAFGIDGRFELFKKDTSFSRTLLQLGTRYQVSATDYIRLYYQSQGNRLITVDTAFVRNNRRLPEDIDVRAQGAGAEVVLNRTDYRISPRRGWQLRLATTALARRVTRSNAIEGLSDGTGFDYGSLYDSLEQEPYQYQVTGELVRYQPLGKQFTLKTGYYGGYISGAQLFRNELYQIGGFRILRGFDEQSIFANQYHLLVGELRLLLNRNSYVYLFSDNAWVQSRFSGFNREGWYNGFGLGTTLETKTGLFSISYGLGRSANNPVQFRQSKIHFGYVAYF